MIGISKSLYGSASLDHGVTGSGPLGLEIPTMKKPIIIASIVLIAALSLTVALADRMKERASHDRFSFGETRATEFL